MYSSFIKLYTSISKESDLVVCIELSKRLKSLVISRRPSRWLWINQRPWVCLGMQILFDSIIPEWRQDRCLPSWGIALVGVCSITSVEVKENVRTVRTARNGEVVPQICISNSRLLYDATLTTVLQDMANALDYVHSELCMTHENVGLSAIMIWLTSALSCKAHKSSEEIEKAKLHCLRHLIWFACLMGCRRRQLNHNGHQFNLTVLIVITFSSTTTKVRIE